MYKKVIDSASGCATRPSLKKARERKCLVELTSTPSFKISKSKDAVPKRDKKTGVFTFKGFAKFKPNKSPSEVFKAGAFGGCYFGNIHSDVTDKTYVGAYKEYPKVYIDVHVGIKYKPIPYISTPPHSLVLNTPPTTVYYHMPDTSHNAT